MTRPERTATPVWSLVLPGRAGELAAAPDGCAVAGAGFVALVRETGELVWSVPTEPGLRRGLVALPGDRLADVEGHHVVVRQAGGTVAARWDGRGVTALAAAQDGDLVYLRWSREAGSSLVRAGADGAPRWSVPLAGRGFHPPLVTREEIVVAEGSRVRALDHGGRTRWTATRDALSAGEPTSPGAGSVREPVVSLGDGRFAVEFTEDVGSALHVLDPHAGTVTWLPKVRPPVAAVPGRVIAAGPVERPDRYGVVPVAEPGEVRWFPARPTALLAGTEGQVIVVTTPDRDRRRGQAPGAVRSLAPDGTQVWVWHPPSPLTSDPVITGDTLYATTGERLWALTVTEP
jgi:outer membrane protein assembly factor BamB